MRRKSNLVLGFLDLKVDVEVHKFRMLLHQLLDTLLLKVFLLVLLEVEHNVGSTGDLGVVGVSLDGKRTSGLAGPQILRVIVVLGVHFDFVSNQVAGVETDT